MLPLTLEPLTKTTLHLAKACNKTECTQQYMLAHPPMVMLDGASSVSVIGHCWYAKCKPMHPPCIMPACMAPSTASISGLRRANVNGWSACSRQPMYTLLLDPEHAVTQLKRRGGGRGVMCSTDTWQLPSPGQRLWKLPLTQPDSCPAPPPSPSPVLSAIHTGHQCPRGETEGWGVGGGGGGISVVGVGGVWGGRKEDTNVVGKWCGTAHTGSAGC